MAADSPTESLAAGELPGVDILAPKHTTASMVRVVSIDEPEGMSPLMLSKSKQVDDFDLDQPIRSQRGDSDRRRLPSRIGSASGTPLDVGEIFTEIGKWIQTERRKKDIRRRKHKTLASISKTFGAVGDILHLPERPIEHRRRRSSDASDSSTALDKLEGLVERGVSLLNYDGNTLPGVKSSGILYRPAALRKLRRSSTAGSSDTDYQDDGRTLVPSCDAVLDNTKTLMYSSYNNTSQADLADSYKGSPTSKQAWMAFKYEIVRLAHTLKLKGWRQIPMERSSEIDVERLSGALTNAVYVVSPPYDLLTPNLADAQQGTSKRLPIKLLLRIYGPQVEHLIDREAELLILRRLARKRIGPRLLGTFLNGRFEEFFHARTLRASDLRVPQTSKQIAKRMRELHDGIELLEAEREGGPFVWKNWDMWVNRVETVVNFIDAQVLNKRGQESLKKRGLVCCVPWEMFRSTVEKYKRWLNEQYGGSARVKERLVFAHNDTQYGNILRLMPPGESPLLLPANEHKQLVVIDFEYANANLPGLEFANHFTEWCYDYHDAQKSYACNTSLYPSPEEQERFIRSYVTHRPQYTPTPSATPKLAPRTNQQSVISGSNQLASSSRPTLRLDGRSPSSGFSAQEPEPEAAIVVHVRRLMHETRLWRAANSAQWIAWGVVQARVPGMGGGNKIDGPACRSAEEHLQLESDPLNNEVKNIRLDREDRRPETETKLEMDNEAEAGEEVIDAAGEEEGFDYLSYAQDRALFFWGDVLGLGIVKEEELPEDLVKKIRVLRY